MCFLMRLWEKVSMSSYSSAILPPSNIFSSVYKVTVTVWSANSNTPLWFFKIKVCHIPGFLDYLQPKILCFFATKATKTCVNSQGIHQSFHASYYLPVSSIASCSNTSKTNRKRLMTLYLLFVSTHLIKALWSQNTSIPRKGSSLNCFLCNDQKKGKGHYLNLWKFRILPWQSWVWCCLFPLDSHLEEAQLLYPLCCSSLDKKRRILI